MRDESPSDGAPDTGMSAGWVICCCASVSFQLFRLSIDSIQTASQTTSSDYKEDHHGVTASANKSSEDASTTSLQSNGKTTPNYGSILEEQASLLPVSADVSDTDTDTDTSSRSRFLRARMSTNPMLQVIPSRNKAAIWSLRVQLLLALLLMIDALLHAGYVLPTGTIWASFVVVMLGAVLTYRDTGRQRFGIVSRVVSLAAALTIWLPICIHYYQRRHDTEASDELVLNAVALYVVLSLAEAFFVDLPQTRVAPEAAVPKKKQLSRAAIISLLRPYFWPDETSDSAATNRIRSLATWVFVILSKVCNLSSPILLGWASTALAHEDYRTCISYSIYYAVIQFFGSTFKEGQSLVYLKVAQAAFVQLSETSFVHLHSLSLDWHLRKKLGETIRSMDRGIAACDTLMKYLFLWLVPALAECLVVCIIFATYFQYLPLAISVFYFVWAYIVWTILVTLWRKKFRKAVVQSDNEWHDRCTDSLINFETVKYFTAEDYERYRFGTSVQKYQAGSVQVQASLSFLNISQKFILQICLAAALSLSAMGIKKRVDCCIDLGCDSGISACCQAIDNNTCPGMQVGDFVAVLTYTIQLFAPLNFLGSVYNAIVMAVIDLTNLSELLAEDPDIVDAPDAMALPPTNEDDESIAVEFDNVVFHYPTQPSTKGLKGVSFKMKRGTTTAIVGPTGAGKTTISRLFFRFYDPLGGAIKVNGKDVRTLTQKSLRGAIGVVPQSASMFNDTIRANLRYGRRDATDEELNQAARDAQLLDFIESMDGGWETMVGGM
jgi:ABC-type transport system involved in Fe-S cluster assembly fused permease/ATPase subunit